ncbi:protein of unknown function [Pararobbsia alpina]
MGKAEGSATAPAQIDLGKRAWGCFNRL